jgi:hypothetical protein
VQGSRIRTYRQRKRALVVGTLPLCVAAVVLLLAPMAAASVVATPALRQKASCSQTSSSELGPYAPGYDAGDKEVYVPNFYNSSVTIVKKTCSIVTTVSLGHGTLGVGADPVQAAYDPENQTTYVTASDSNGEFAGLYGFSGSKIVSRVAVSSDGFNEPWSILYDPMLGANRYPSSPGGLIVGDVGNATLSAINTKEGYLGSVSLRDVDISFMAYDAGANTVAVSNSDGSNVTLLNGTTLALVSTVPVVGTAVNWVTFDSSNHDFYALTEVQPNVTVFNGSTGARVGTIASSYFDNTRYPPYSVGYLAKSKMILVGLQDYDVVEIEGLSVHAELTTSAYDIEGMVYDPSDGDMYLAGLGSDSISVVGT